MRNQVQSDAARRFAREAYDEAVYDAQVHEERAWERERLGPVDYIAQLVALMADEPTSKEITHSQWIAAHSPNSGYRYLPTNTNAPTCTATGSRLTCLLHGDHTVHLSPTMIGWLR